MLLYFSMNVQSCIHHRHKETNIHFLNKRTVFVTVCYVKTERKAKRM